MQELHYQLQQNGNHLLLEEKQMKLILPMSPTQIETRELSTLQQHTKVQHNIIASYLLIKLSDLEPLVHCFCFQFQGSVFDSF